MAFVTKNGIVWQWKDSVSLKASAFFFIPIPFHAFPFAFLVRGFKVKAFAQLLWGFFFLSIESILAAIFIVNTPPKGEVANDFQLAMAFISISGFILCYILGMIVLSMQTIKYLKRRYLLRTEGVDWSFSLSVPEQVVDLSKLSNSEIFIRQLETLKNEIENFSIRDNIDRMVYLFKIIDKKDKVAAEKFLIMHSTVVKVLTQYDEIENSRLNNVTAIDSKKQLEDVIRKATLAFEQELTNQFKSEILDVAAETETYLQQLKNKNLLNNK